MPLGCFLSAFLGHALCDLGFKASPERKWDRFGSAFCVENMIHIVFVYFTASPQGRHFLHFGVARDSRFGCLGPPFELLGAFGALIAA